MSLFAYEVGDLLSERSLELSLLSALSVVGADGAHPDAAGSGSFGPLGDSLGGGEGADGELGGAGQGEGSLLQPSGSMSGLSDAGAKEEDMLRSQLIQMYLPEYKK